jgi:hypothetical protein
VTVGYSACVFAGGGNATVPAGSDVAFRVGLSWTNRGRTQSFINAQTTSASVNGTPMAGASSLWGTPEPLGGGWVTFWSAPVGSLASPGDVVVVELQIAMQHGVPAGKDPATGRQIFVGPGNVFPAGFTTCVITAV